MRSTSTTAPTSTSSPTSPKGRARPGRRGGRRSRRVTAGAAVLGLGAALLATGGAAGASAPGTDQVASQDSPQPMIVFHDDFEGEAGQGVNESLWSHDPGDNINNLELQYYTEGTENAALDGEGHLVITAEEAEPGAYSCYYGDCEYTSARLNTQDTFHAEYGTIEARVQLPEGQGIWPAFWMLGSGFPEVPWPDSGEIDIMELVGHEMDTVHGTLHGPGYSGGGGVGASYTLPDGGSFSDGFHTFAIDWEPDSITWSVDGEVFNRLTPEDVPGDWVYNQPFFLILNVAVGGEWPGYPDDSTEFPQRMVVDHVTVTTYE